VGGLGPLERGVEARGAVLHVRERRAQRLVVDVDAVAERDLLAALVRGQQRPCDDAELDVHDVVGETAAVGEPTGVAGEDAEPVRVGGRRDAEVDLQRVGRDRVVTDLGQPGDAGEERLDDVRAVLLLDAQPEQRVEDAGGLGVHGVRPEVGRVVGGPRTVELVLLPERDDHLVDERVAETADLHPRARLVRLAGVAPGAGRHRVVRVEPVGDLQPPALRGRPHADDRVGRLGAGDGAPGAGDLALRDLQDERVGVVARDVVLAAALVAQPDARAAGLIDVDAVEDRAEVDEERVVDRPDERLAAAGDPADGTVGHGWVIGERLGPGVVRGDGQVVTDEMAADELPVVVAVLPEVVRLDEVDVLVVDRPHRRHVGQERVRVAEPRRELPVVADVLDAVARVVDLDVVAGLRIELPEVRPAGGILEWDPVRDDRQPVRRIRRREGVEVGVVGGRVEHDLRSLSVARAEHAGDRHCRGGRRDGCRRDEGGDLAHLPS
jgi:hypothetical protein